MAARTSIRHAGNTVRVTLDAITAEVARLFDYPFDGSTTFLPPRIDGLPEEFSLGLIVGPSGSGKSSLLSQFGNAVLIDWDSSKAICSHFATVSDCVDRLSAVGLNSIPSWLRPYHVLSTGEQFRADLARRLSSGALIDEFTSTVDRNVARSCALAIRRYVDKAALTRLVFATCHYDVIDWLQPDWVFDTAAEHLTVGRSERRPVIEVDLVPCASRLWSMFRAHHYLDGDINPSARCWLAVWRGTPVGFASALAFPNGNIRNAWRGHRTVVLPDFQGLGIGVRISDAIGELYLSQGCRYFSKTAHPRMGAYREASPKWRATSKNKKNRSDYNLAHKTKEDGHKMRHLSRVCYSHEYVGLRAAVDCAAGG